MKLHCIVCNCLWGDGEFLYSSGVCPTCFAKWANSKRKSNGLPECYGKYNGVNCDTCPLSKLCSKDTYKDAYGI